MRSGRTARDTADKVENVMPPKKVKISLSFVEIKCRENFKRCSWIYKMLLWLNQE